MTREIHEVVMIGIIGPYFGDGKRKTIKKNIQKAEKYAIALANKNIPFFCPHLHTRHFETKAKAPEDFYRHLDLFILTKTCSAILVLPGYETSKGTLAEIAEFKKLGRPIFYAKSPSNLSEIEKWTKKAQKYINLARKKTEERVLP